MRCAEGSPSHASTNLSRPPPPPHFPFNATWVMPRDLRSKKWLTTKWFTFARLPPVAPNNRRRRPSLLSSGGVPSSTTRKSFEFVTYRNDAASSGNSKTRYNIFSVVSAECMLVPGTVEPHPTQESHRASAAGQLEARRHHKPVG